jgi:hypothetical protein
MGHIRLAAVVADQNVNPLAHVLPALALSVSRASAHPGPTVGVGLQARHRGPAFGADFYLGVLRPDGATACFVVAPSPPGQVCLFLHSDPAAFPSLASGLVVPSDLALSVDDLVQLPVSATDPPGPHAVFAVLTPPAALGDHRLDPGDILLADVQPFCVNP